MTKKDTSPYFFYIFPFALLLVYSIIYGSDTHIEIPDKYVGTKKKDINLTILWVPFFVLFFVSFFFSTKYSNNEKPINYLLKNVWIIGFLISLITLLIYCSIIIHHRHEIKNELNKVNKDTQNYNEIINNVFGPILGFSSLFIPIIIANYIYIFLKFISILSIYYKK